MSGKYSFAGSLSNFKLTVIFCQHLEDDFPLLAQIIAVEKSGGLIIVLLRAVCSLTVLRAPFFP